MKRRAHRLNCRPLRPSLAPERLESRVLLSLTWSTDTSSAGQFAPNALAADKVGDVYAAGYDINHNAVLRERTPDGTWATLLSTNTGDGLGFSTVALDAAGDIFVGGRAVDPDTTQHARIWEQPAGQPGVLKLIDDVPSNSNGGALDVATDSAGNVWATECLTVTTTQTQHNQTTTTTTSPFAVRELVPSETSPSGFVATTVYQSTSVFFQPYTSHLTVIDSGPSAGVYALGTERPTSGAHKWLVLKGTATGSAWSVVDEFQYDSTAAEAYGYENIAHAIAADSAGNVFAAGWGVKAVITGYNKNHTPIYSYVPHWLVRESASGDSGSWNTVDDYLPAGATQAIAYGLGVDRAGNVYATGTVIDSGNQIHEVIRTNAGGSWATTDDYPKFDGTSFAYTAFISDSAGNLYAGGRTSILRTAVGPMSPTNVLVANPIATPQATTSVAAVLASAQVTRPSDSTADLLHRKRRLI